MDRFEAEAIQRTAPNWDAACQELTPAKPITSQDSIA